MERPQKCTLWTGLEEADTEWAYRVIRVCVCVCVCVQVNLCMSVLLVIQGKENKKGNKHKAVVPKPAVQEES